jgi:tRNA A37 threonylcarbamoyladenosine dehydratase
MGNVKSVKSPLSIAVLGVGRIGSIFAYQLARAGTW